MTLVDDPVLDVHERITDRVNRARLEIELRRALGPLAVLAVGAIVGLAAWAVIAYNVSSGTFQATRQFSVEVRDAKSVVAGRHEVRIHGLEVGVITASRLVDGQARLTVKMGSKYGKVYRDARAQLRPNTALQDMYLDIVDRGTPAAGEVTMDTPLPQDRTSTQVDVSKILQTFDPVTRERMGTLLTELGGGLDGHGDDLREAFEQIAPTLRDAGKLTRELAVRKTTTRRLVTNFNLLTDELVRRDASVRRLVRDGGATLSNLGRSAPGLDATLRQLPPTLREVSDTLTAVKGVLPAADEAVTRLYPAADALPGALASVRRLSGDAAPALRALGPPVRQLVPLAQALKPAASSLETAATLLNPQVAAIDHVTKSTAGCTLAIYGFMQWTSSVVKYNDGRGIYPRGDAVLSSASAAGGTDNTTERPSRGCAPGIAKGGTP